MKKIITNCLATTALALLVLDMVAIINRAHFICVETVFQILFASILVQILHWLLQKIETTYFILDIALDIGGIIGILIVLGYLFSWYDSISVTTLVIMAVIIYITGIMIQVFNIQKDLDYINHKLSGNGKKE